MQTSTSIEKRERRKEARPAELIAAALELFVEKGFAATRAEEVAKKAGVSKGTLFIYFPSKEELFKAVVREHIAGRIKEAFAELAGFEGSSADLLRYLMLQWWQRYGCTQASGISQLMMAESHNFPALADFYQQEVTAPACQLIGKVIERGMASGEFRVLDVHYATHAVLAPIMHLVVCKHSYGACAAGGANLDPMVYLNTQADIIVRGLLNLETAVDRSFPAGNPYEK